MTARTGHHHRAGPVKWLRITCEKCGFFFIRKEGAGVIVVNPHEGCGGRLTVKPHKIEDPDRVRRCEPAL